MTQKHIENAYNDLLKNIIEEEKQIKEENFWPIYNGIVLCYKKCKLKLELGENYNSFLYRGMAEKQLKSLQNLMKTLPDYKQFFKEESYEDNLRDYMQYCPNELSFEGEDYEKIIKNTIERVVNYLVTKSNSLSKVDIDIDKHVYAKGVEDFEENKKIINPQFLDIIKNQRGEEGVKNLMNHMRELSQDSIHSQGLYYGKVSKNICQMYANIEMAKNLEDELE